MPSVSYFRVFMLATTCVGILAACKAQQNRSKTESVDTPVVSDNLITETGFRWAYGTTDFLQTEHKKDSGEQVNLSEEALGFYRMSENLAHIFKANTDPVDAIDAVSCLDFYGLQAQNIGSINSLNGYELAEKYGVVTEEAYPVKFIHMSQQTETFQGILERVKQMLSLKKPAQVSINDIQQRILLKPDASKSTRSAFISAPPTTFEYQEKKWSAKAFFASHMTDAAKPYQLIEFSTSAEYEKMISLIKKTLAGGYSVPFDLGVDRRLLADASSPSMFTGKKFALSIPAEKKKVKSSDTCKPAGDGFPQAYHSSLIVDFVNKGSKEGSFENENQLQREVVKDGSELEYIKIKNQWGIDELAGDKWPVPPDGSIRVDQEYLLASLKNGVTLRIVVPKSVVAGVK